MKKLIYRSINTFSLIIFLAIALLAQTKPDEVPDPSNSLAGLRAGEKFTSVEGRFTIAAPKNGVEFEKIVPTEDSPGDTGGRYTWFLKEGVITIEYNDTPDYQVKTEKDYADLAEGLRGGIAVFNGTVTSERVIKLGTYRGYEVKFNDPAELKGITRMLIVGTRKYTLFYLSLPGFTGSSDLAVKALDSFKLTAAKGVVKKPVKKTVKVTRKN